MSAQAAIRPLSLYHLTEDLAALEYDLLESGGVLTPEIEARYAALLEAHADKVEGYVAMIRKFEATATGIRAERERLEAAEKTMKNAAKSLKGRLCDAMIRRGETVHETALGKVRLQRSGSRPLVLKADLDDLPERFRRVRVEADLRALKDALKADDPEAAAVAQLGEASHYVRIY